MTRFASLLSAFLICLGAFGQGTTPQQINLLPIADQLYGVAPFQVIALSSAYLPVTLTATGPVTLNGRWLTVTGVGTVTISAQQAGNSVYAPASAEEQFTILPGEPVVQAQPATIVYGTPFNPSIFNASAMAVPAADPAADVPTVTWQLDDSQITGGSSVSVPYNSPLLRYESSPMVVTTTASGRQGTIPDPTMVVDHYYKVAFTCDCQQFEFALQSQTANYRLWVDGSWTTADVVPLQNDSPRTLFYLVAFPDKRPRQIKLLVDEGTPFFGVNASPSDTISAPQVPLGKRVIIYGDSLTTPIISEPSLPPTQPGLNGSGYPQVLGEYFNWDWWESGLSGSGFTMGGIGNLTFTQRALTDICGRNPDLVVLFGGINDASSTEQSTQQGATDFLAEINACLPGTPIYLLGPQAPSTSVGTAMAAAAALFPTTVEFGGTAPQFWVYGDRSDPTTGNAYLFLGDLNFNGGHPTPLGHDFLAEEVATTILGISPSLTPQAFNLFAPAPAIGSFGYSQPANTVLSAGNHQISVTFTPADAVNYAVVTQSVSLTVNRASSSLALAASANNIVAGGKLTLTAKVSPQIAGVPTGTVTFSADGQPLGNASLDTTGSAAFPTTGLAPGSHSVSAFYAGDGNFLPAASPPPVTVTVGPYPPPIGNLEQAKDATTGSTAVSPTDNLFVGGWIADPTDGSPLSNVKVLIDGVVIGTPTLSIARPDVASGLNNPAYLNSGFAFVYAASLLKTGTHAVTVVGVNSHGISVTLGPLSFTIRYPPPIGNLEQAKDATTGSTTIAPTDSLFVVGWIADPTDGSPMSNVKVLIDGVVIGAPTLGIARPDVALAKNNPAYLNSGFALVYAASLLKAGTHAVTVVGVNSHGISLTLGPLSIAVIPPPVGHLERAADATTGSTTVSSADNLFVGGWIADPTDGSPMSNVKVLIDGVVIGTPTLGTARPDVASGLNNPAYLNSGFAFVYAASLLKAGTHSVNVVGVNSHGVSLTLGPLSIAVIPPPVGHLERAADATTGSTTVSSADNLFVGGWIADPTDGSPMSNVKVLIDGVVIGTPTLGTARPDVASGLNNPAYLNSGFAFVYAASLLKAGTHSVTVVGVNSHGISVTLGPLRFTIATAVAYLPPVGDMNHANGAASGNFPITCG